MKALAGISRRQFAKLDGCDPKVVRDAIDRGTLTILPDGSLDPALIGTGWRRGNRIRNEATVGQPIDFDAAASFLTDVLAGRVRPRGDAETHKENALAAIRTIELLKLAGTLVEIGDVASVVGQQQAVLRTKLLALPAEIAPRIARLKSPAEVQDALLGAITEAMEELVGYAVVPDRKSSGAPPKSTQKTGRG